MKIDLNAWRLPAVVDPWFLFEGGGPKKVVEFCGKSKIFM